MEDRISTLLAKAFDALKCGDDAQAKHYTLKANIAADVEKTKYVYDQVSETTEQILASQYSSIYYLLEKVNENVAAARCLYKAMLFDPYLSSGKYRPRIDAVWKKICQTKHVDNMTGLLMDIAELAKLATDFKKWSVALEIYKDFFTYYSSVRSLETKKSLRGCKQTKKHSDTEIGMEELLKHKEVAEAMKCCTRCYLKLGMHENLRRSCCLILKEACDYDDSETLELWARSLYESNDLDLAFDKCRLALKYCKNEENTNQLKDLMSEIQGKMNAVQICVTAPVEDWLEGTNINITRSSKVPKHSEKGRKKGEKRTKTKDCLGPCSSLQSENSSLGAIEEVQCSSDPSPITTKLICKTIEKLKNVEEYTDRRKRFFVTLRTATQETSGYESYESDNESADTTTAHSTKCGKYHTGENLWSDTEEDNEQDSFSFYEQSCKLHSNDHSVMNELDKDQKLLQTGILLCQSFLYRFGDTPDFIRTRAPFYTEFLQKSELEQMLLREPKKYVKCVIELKRCHDAVCIPVNSHDETNTIEISGRQKIGQVFNEDEVIVEILNDTNAEGKRFGKVVGIWNRRHMKNVKHPVFICTLDVKDGSVSAQPLCKTVSKVSLIGMEIARKYNQKKSRRNKIEIYEYNETEGRLCNVRIEDVNPAEQNSRIHLVAYIKWGLRDRYPLGAIIKTFPVGKSISSGVNLLNLQHRVPKFYRKETVNQVASLLEHNIDEPTPLFLQDRIDLTGMSVFTIDPVNSHDLDDALSFEKLETGYKVGVHIADVSAYIEKDSPIDREAKQRGNTFYSDIQNPRYMLPEHLSTHLFSLIPEKVRLTISVFFYIDRNGRPLQMEGNNCEIVKSYIRSKRRLTYEEAQAMISGDQRDDDKIAKDVKGLFKVAHMIRKNRLGNSMLAMDLDSEGNDITEESREAHYLVEELMIMANKTVAKRLLRWTCNSCVPLRCHQPPSKECLEDFVRKYGNYMNIPFRLQDKQIGSNRISFKECFGSVSPILIPSLVWEQIASTNENAAKYIRTDDLHPIQLSVYRDWISIQKRASYRCSGSLSSKIDATHYSLATYPYIHFTSPIRRYNDLVVHRLVHASVFDKTSSPYTQEEIENICEHLNSVTKQVNAFQKDCKILSQLFDLKNNPRIVNCCVTDVTNTGAHICSGSLNLDMELAFNLLDIRKKTDVYKDSFSKLSRVDATWKKRLYNFDAIAKDHPGSVSKLCRVNATGKKRLYKSDAKANDHPSTGEELKLNPYKGFVTITLDHWAKILQCIVEGRIGDLRKLVKNHALMKNNHTGTHDDVSTECTNTSYLRQSIEFSMMFSQGQQIQLQMSSELEKGKIVPKPVLLNMTENVKLCLLHQENPVLHLCRYATRPTIDQYRSTKSYVERWLPIILMESATNTILNGNTFCINNLKVEFLDERKGSFSLSLKECGVRNIVFSGGEDVSSDGQKVLSSYDWLCLKRVLHTNVAEKSIRPRLGNVWIGHAVVNDIKKDKGVLTVMFTLHEKAPDLPPLASANDRFSVEVLTKPASDRQNEGLIKSLPLVPDILASKIALNEAIPDLDRSRKHIAASIEHDMYYSTVDLPKNNKKQQEAIDNALVSRFSLIQGPPGTGKTHSGIKLIYLFDKINDISQKEGNPRKRVLFCGPTNKSVDLVADWMYRRLGKACPRFVRVYSQAIETADYPRPGLPFDYEKYKMPTGLRPVTLHHLIRQEGKPYAEKIKAFDEQFKLSNYMFKPELGKTWEEFHSEVLKYIQVLKTASAEEIREHDVILCTTAVGSNTNVINRNIVQQIIIDEAGMCSEPQCLAPIIASEAKQVVLIGDHKQLRPTVICKEAASLGLDKSLFERYAETKCARNVQITMLQEQYRMNPQLCRFPSEQFYNGLLVTKTGRWCTGGDIWPKGAREKYPFVFVHVEGKEKREKRTLAISTEDGHEQSKSNEAEIDHVLKVYSYITEVQPKATVRIVSQYNAQCSEIKRRLRINQVSDENVSTVVSSQGGEWDYVIFSTVRSLPRYKIESSPTIGWCRQNLGFITDQNQINVALTRARKGLMIIGNKDLLICDRVWKDLIDLYQERDCVKTVDDFPPRLRLRKSRNGNTSKQKFQIKNIEHRSSAQQTGSTTTERVEEGWQKVQKKKRR
ncbi:LOW QUALITY PROTEIN: helicase with zinc finger domain 2-like [Mercenaria mercenaria]|uniref:LOW QUALITY PROTEIN: helicase with zinc finger domain 2-like n=1 Tax=Mercenaria mercenaria TaxID=6596 RepID=UPI00234EB977|nr:LOW QUALITY PROTEIN: helicase with zinc finger domain 2-like [Mercenaria mercenaria]